MRGILTFTSSCEEVSEYDHPKGYFICKFLADNLPQYGFVVTPQENYRDIAWSVDCEVNTNKIFFFVGYLGTETADWQLIICSNKGFISRKLGFSDEKERTELALAIHKILSNDSRFSEMRWYCRYSGTLKDKWFAEPVDSVTV